LFLVLGRLGTRIRVSHFISRPPLQSRQWDSTESSVLFRNLQPKQIYPANQPRTPHVVSSLGLEEQKKKARNRKDLSSEELWIGDLREDRQRHRSPPCTSPPGISRDVTSSTPRTKLQECHSALSWSCNLKPDVSCPRRRLNCAPPRTGSQQLAFQRPQYPPRTSILELRGSRRCLGEQV